MGNINEMAGIGMPTEHAKAWVGSKNTATAVGSAQGDAAALGLSGLITVSGADAATGVILNAALPVDSSQILVNAAAAALLVYPPTGGAINGLSANGAYTVGANTSAIVVRVSETAWAIVSD